MSGIHHIAVSVRDLDRSVDFYMRVMDCEVLSEYHDEEVDIVFLDLHNIKIEMFCFRDNKELPEVHRQLDTDLRVAGVKHFAVHVDDVDEAHKNLPADVEVVKGPKNARNSYRYFFIRDPDGTLIEFIQDL